MHKSQWGSSLHIPVDLLQIAVSCVDQAGVVKLLFIFTDQCLHVN